MALVMLRGTWPGSFRRTITKGKKSKVIVFQPGEPVEVPASDIKQLESDIGKALMPVELDDKGKPRVITDDVEAEPESDPAATTETGGKEAGGDSDAAESTTTEPGNESQSAGS